MERACPKCGLPVANGTYCPEHGQRGKPSRPYSSSAFQRNRRQLIKRQPVCATVGCTNPSKVAHHKPARYKLVANGVDDPDALCWLIGLCEPCHNALPLQDR